ncbi:MAG: FMN-binding protein, partial [Neisseria sp.]|nr:FMN-binding protein [Neisseria sp.]
MFSLFAPQVSAERLPEFLSKVPVSEIFPGADRYGKPEGKPMVSRIYKGSEAVGLAYITSDVVNTRGYSSKPIDTMIALDNGGKVMGAKLVHHSEPIMLIGIPQTKVDAFIDGYKGLDFVKAPPKTGVAPSDIISGATVTLMVINDSIQRSAKAIIRTYHLGTPQAFSDGKAAENGASAAAAEPQTATRPRRMVNPDKQ